MCLKKFENCIFFLHVKDSLKTGIFFLQVKDSLKTDFFFTYKT